MSSHTTYIGSEGGRKSNRTETNSASFTQPRDRRRPTWVCRQVARVCGTWRRKRGEKGVCVFSYQRKISGPDRSSGDPGGRFKRLASVTQKRTNVVLRRTLPTSFLALFTPPSILLYRDEIMGEGKEFTIVEKEGHQACIHSCT